MSDLSMKYQNDMNGNFLLMSLPEADADRIALNILKQDLPGFIIPVTYTDMDGQIVLKYNLTGLVAMKYAEVFLDFREYEFLDFFQKILKHFVECSEWFLDYHNLFLEMQGIYFDKKSRELKWLYVPEESNVFDDQSIRGILRDILLNCSVKDHEALPLVLIKKLENSYMTLAELRQGILEMQSVKETPANPTPSIQVKPSVAQSEPERTSSKAVELVQQLNLRKPEVKVEKEISAEEPEKEPSMEDLFGEKSKIQKKDKVKKDKELREQEKKEKKEKKEKQKQEKSRGFHFFWKKSEAGAEVSKEKPLIQNMEQLADYIAQENDVKPIDVYPPVQESVRGGEIYEDDSSTVIMDDMPAAGGYLQLEYAYEAGAPERIDLNFAGEKILIGRVSSDVKKADILFPSNFKAIGRMHAQIQRINGQYYIVDLGSANHTYLNGEELPTSKPYLLENGQTVSFTRSKPVRYRVFMR